MKKDRTAINKIISTMLDNPDPVGIYPTSVAYDELEAYVAEVRVEALGWMLADCCVFLDKGDDPRKRNVPEILERALIDLAVEGD
jgi:hypothetical protein